MHGLGGAIYCHSFHLTMEIINKKCLCSFYSYCPGLLLLLLLLLNAHGRSRHFWRENFSAEYAIKVQSLFYDFYSEWDTICTKINAICHKLGPVYETAESFFFLKWILSSNLVWCIWISKQRGFILNKIGGKGVHNIFFYLFSLKYRHSWVILSIKNVKHFTRSNAALACAGNEKKI